MGSGGVQNGFMFAPGLGEQPGSAGQVAEEDVVVAIVVVGLFEGGEGLVKGVAGNELESVV